MSFLAGVVDFAGPLDLQTVSLWTTDLKRCTAHRLSCLQKVNFGNGVLFSEGRLQKFPNEKSWLAVDGNVESILCDLNTPDADSLLLKTPINGDYALAYCSPEKVYLRKGILGSQPLYYSKRGSRVFWASEIKSILALIGELPEIEEEGLNDHLFFGSRPFAVTHKTSFKNIHALEAGHVVKFSVYSTKKQQVEDFDLKAPRRRINFVDACSEFQHLFEESLKSKCRGHKAAVSLSGGLDSSAIFASAHRLGLEPVGITYYPNHAAHIDKLYGVSELERQLGFTCQKIEVDQHLGFLNSCSYQLWINEAPFLDSFWGVRSAVFRTASLHGCDVLLSGRLGNRLMLCKGGMFGFWRELLQEIIKGRVEKNLYSEFRSKSHLMRSDWMNKISATFGLKTALPYLDKNLIQFLLEIPEEMINYGNTNSNLLKKSVAKDLPPRILNGKTSVYSHWDSPILENEFAEMKKLVGLQNKNQMRSLELGLIDLKDLPKSSTRRADKKLIFNLYALELWLEKYTDGFFKHLQQISTDSVRVIDVENDSSRPAPPTPWTTGWDLPHSPSIA